MKHSEAGEGCRPRRPVGRRRPTGRAGAAVVLAVGGLGLAACSSGSSASDSGTALQTVTYAYPAVSAATTPELLMQTEPAMCAQFGVKPQVTALFPGAANPAVAAGKVDATRGGPTSFLLSEVASPGAAKIIGTITGGQPTKFWGSKDMHSVADLKGKTVAASSAGSTTDIAARQILAAAGMTPGKDVQITYGSTSNALFGLAASGAVQGFMQTSPLPVALTQAGWHVLADVSGNPLTAPLLKTVITANTQFIHDHPAAIKGLLQCEAAAEKVINADPRKAADLLATASRTDSAAAAVQVAALEPFGLAKLPPDDVTTIANVLQKNNVKDFSSTNLSNTVDSSFVP